VSKTLKIMIVAGEASGDTHATKLVNALRETRPERTFEVFGAAGPKMRTAGVDAVVLSDDLAVVGLVEIFARLPLFWRTYQALKRAAIERQPDAVILVDFPDFNLRLARWLKRRGLTVIYYISPQLWAWRKGRVRAVRDDVNMMLSILPFEKEWYARHGVAHVEYVGSPLAREVYPTRDRSEFGRAHGLDTGKPIIALLPGSRDKEISRIWPVMLDAVVETARRRSDVQFVAAVASERDVEIINAAIEARLGEIPDGIRVVMGETYDALRSADAAAVASGTATLEAAILGTPLVVVYKTSALNYALFEPMIDVAHYGLVNLIAGERVAKELIQGEFTAETLSAELLRLIDPDVNAAARSEVRKAAEKLGHGGASKRAAAAILKLIDQKAGGS
jgi:lipid-A-disaccharide synthase